ncbi:MAG: DUF3575 domain-containing protein [Bacteroidales bacterium]|nr:DUF3575 domain-containing protein [Bacteroidales bacterium]
MKNNAILLPVLVLLINLLITNKVYNQDNKENVVTTSISNLALLAPTIYYERVLGDHMSAKMGAFYNRLTVIEITRSGYGVVPEFRYYMGEKGAPRGLYVAPFYKYQFCEYSSPNVDPDTHKSYIARLNMNGYGGGIVVGAQFGNSFVFDMFLGPSYTNWKTISSERPTDDDAISDKSFLKEGPLFGVRFGLSMGFGF